MERCAVHECEQEGTEPFEILGRKRLFRRGHVVEVSTWICEDHSRVLEESSGMSVYAHPEGILYLPAGARAGRRQSRGGDARRPAPLRDAGLVGRAQVSG